VRPSVFAAQILVITSSNSFVVDVRWLAISAFLPAEGYPPRCRTPLPFTPGVAPADVAWRIVEIMGPAHLTNRTLGWD